MSFIFSLLIGYVIIGVLVLFLQFVGLAFVNLVSVGWIVLALSFIHIYYCKAIISANQCAPSSSTTSTEDEQTFATEVGLCGFWVIGVTWYAITENRELDSLFVKFGATCVFWMVYSLIVSPLWRTLMRNLCGKSHMHIKAIRIVGSSLKVSLFVIFPFSIYWA